MQNYDPRKAAQVWQRVQKQSPPLPEHPPVDDLLSLLIHEWTDAATYLQLSRQYQGKEAAALRKLFEEEQSHAACLKGIYTLLTGEKPVIHTPKTENATKEATLRRCYGREMQCLAQYERKSSDPEYGQVFARLAQQERSHCMTILELLGKL